MCGKHTLAEVLVERSKISYHAAKDLVNSLGFRRLSPTKLSSTSGGRLIKPPHVGPLLPAHRDYLRDRGFHPNKLVKLWDLAGIGLSSHLKWRIFIPISLNSHEISWTTRSISDNGRRYITAKPDQERLHYKDSVYGIDLVRNAVIITEGPTDVWKIGPGAVCLYGLNYTVGQIQLLKHFPVRIVCLDNQHDAQKKARELTETLSMYPGCTYNVQLDSEDPGSASTKEISALRKLLAGP